MFLCVHIYVFAVFDVLFIVCMYVCRATGPFGV